MHVILPITSLAIDLQSSTNFFCLRYNLNTIELDSSIDIIRAMIDDEINSRLFWANPTQHLDQSLEQNVTWWSGSHALQGDDAASEICQAYYCNVIDNTLIRIGALLTQLMGSPESEDMWHVWYTMPIANDLLIERGEDYRVVEFERQVLSGETQVNPKVSRLIRQKYAGGYR